MCLGTTGRIVEIVDPAQHLARAEIDGSIKDVNTAMLAAQGETVEVGDWVHLHLDFVLEKTDEAHALESLRFQRSLEEGNFPEAGDHLLGKHG